MSIQRIAVIGDPHGCVNEFRRVVNQLEWLSLDEIWTIGDLVDRGPSSSGVIDICINKGIKSVMGNHEDSIISHYDRISRGGNLPYNKEKTRTLQQLEQRHWDYIKPLPPLHVFDDLGLVLVHGGLWPKIPLYKQPYGVIRAQMINPDLPGATRWWGTDAQLSLTGKSEEQNVKDGFQRWYKLYDHEQDVIYGHSTFAQPMIYQPEGAGKTIGIDTGSCFGGSVTACIYDTSRTFYFVSVKSSQVYCPDTRRSFWEAD